MPDRSPILIFTGGHHTSALVVAKQLMASGIQIVWLGHRHSMWQDSSDSVEYREVTSCGIPFYKLLAGKFYHTWHPLKLIRLPWGFIQSLFILFLLKIKYGTRLKGIYSSGGYLAVPVVFCGWLLGIPSVTHEQTSVAGWANRFISRFVKKIALTWPSSYYPQSKSRVTGLPLRPEILSLKRHPDRTLLVLGGKQGSHVINQIIFACLSSLSSYHVIHQVGSNSFYQDYQHAAKLKNDHYLPVEYLSPLEISQIYSHCSLVICRAGAHTIYELAYLGIPCVLIPLPQASHDEQTTNAGILVSAHQAILLPQNQLNPQSLIAAIHQASTLKPDKIPISLDGADRVVQLIKQELLHA